MGRIGWIVIAIISTVPIILWLTMRPLEMRFAGWYLTILSVGQLAGLLGYIFFAISLMLSVRLKAIEPFFGGLNRVYIAHHVVGGLAFIFVLLHPLFLAYTRATISLKEAALFLLPGQDIAINFGIASLMSMMALLLVTFFIKLKYNIWRFTHQYLGVAFIFSAIHMALIKSDVSYSPQLYWYLVVISAMGISSYLYRSILGRWLVRRYDYLVTCVRQLSPLITEITLAPTSRALNFLPGQFVFVGFDTASPIGDEVHPFSICSPPNTGHLVITAKTLGDYTGKLSSLQPGVKARIEGPYGRFSYLYHHTPEQIWIAGGIGITPFISMAGNLITQQNNVKSVTLIYSVRAGQEAIYLTELASIQAQLPFFRFILWQTSQYGRLSAKSIEQSSDPLMTKEIFICGPQPLMKQLRSQFVKRGVSNSRIHTEEFTMT